MPEIIITVIVKKKVTEEIRTEWDIILFPMEVMVCENCGERYWFDEESLLAGQNWKNTITQAINKSKYFIALLSSNSVNKRGYIQIKDESALLDYIEIEPLSSKLIHQLTEHCTGYGYHPATEFNFYFNNINQRR
jgi:hypothetical protein